MFHNVQLTHMHINDISILNMFCHVLSISLHIIDPVLPCLEHLLPLLAG